MGKNDEIDCRQLFNRERGRRQALWTDRKPGKPDANPWEKGGVGQNVYAEKVDQNSGMA
jgi:hypothetical protein